MIITKKLASISNSVSGDPADPYWDPPPPPPPRKGLLLEVPPVPGYQIGCWEHPARKSGALSDVSQIATKPFGSAGSQGGRKLRWRGDGGQLHGHKVAVSHLFPMGAKKMAKGLL